MSTRAPRPGRAVTTLADFRTQRVNANKHSQRGLGMLDAAMAEDGYVAPMTAAASGEIIDGSARLERAAEHFGPDVEPIVVEHDGKRPIVMVRTDIPSADTEVAARISLRANRIAQADLAWSPEELAQIVAAYPNVTKGLWTPEEMAELAGLMAGAGSDADAEPQIDRAAELAKEWGTATGQLWGLGEHRLLCGDVRTDGAALFVGEQYSLLVTDPPYGVSYADKNRFLNATGRGNRIQEPIEADHQTPEQMSAFWSQCFTALRVHAVRGASYYVTGPQGGDLLLLLLLALRDSGFPLHHMLIWAKNNHVLGRCDYHYKHEPIVYGWVEGAGHHFYGDHSQFSLWEIDKPQRSEMHPTTKPVELYVRAITNSSAPGEIVADGFCGSGTAIIACENTGRRCRAVEIAPGYVAVALQRYVDSGGTQPVLLDQAADGDPMDARRPHG